MTTTNQDGLREFVGSHLPQGKKTKTNKPKSNCILQISAPVFLTTWLKFQVHMLESFGNRQIQSFVWNNASSGVFK